MTRGKKLIFILLPLGCCLIGAFLFRNWLECNYGVYIPVKSDDRFMTLVLEAQERGDQTFLARVATDEAISMLGALEFPQSQTPDQLTLVTRIDPLNMTFNSRATFENGDYFEFWLEYDRWPTCPADHFTDEAVISHFRLIRVGDYHKAEAAENN